MNENKIKNYFNKNSNYWEKFYSESNNLVEAILIERKNIIKKFIIDNFEKNVKILDLGGGTGVMSSELILSGFQVDMIDISKNMIEQAKQNYMNLGISINENKLINEDFLSKNFNNKYDIIIALGYFEYQTNYDLNFNKIYDCLNSNGTAFIVLTLCVISSPLKPSPLVNALFSNPFSYINDTPKPSILGSATKLTSELFNHFTIRL